MNPDFDLHQWLIAALAAFSVGLSKSGFAGIGILPVILMAEIMPARESTGALLPMLIVGDIFAVLAFKKHAQWNHVIRLLPPAIVGVVLGWAIMGKIPTGHFRILMGLIVLLMVVLEIFRRLRPKLFEQIPHTHAFAWSMGGWAGVTTMLANAAGPVMIMYLLAVDLPKLQFVGTSAWFFLILNLSKVPFSYHLGLINMDTLTLNLIMVPIVGLGVLGGRLLIGFIPQRLFVTLVLVFAGLASIRLIWF